MVNEGHNTVPASALPQRPQVAQCAVRRSRIRLAQRQAPAQPMPPHESVYGGPHSPPFSCNVLLN